MAQIPVCYLGLCISPIMSLLLHEPCIAVQLLICVASSNIAQRVDHILVDVFNVQVGLSRQHILQRNLECKRFDGGIMMNKNQHFLSLVLAVALSLCNIVLAGEVAGVSLEEMRSAVYDELPEGRFTSLSDSAIFDLYSDIANLVVSEDIKYYRITYTIDESTSSRSSGRVDVVDSYIEEVSYDDYLDKVVPESTRGGGSTYNSWILLSCYVTRNSSTAGYGDVAFAWLSHPTFYIENYFVVGLNGATYGNTTSKNWYHVYNGSTFWHTMSTKLTNTYGAVFGNIIPYNLNQ